MSNKSNPAVIGGFVIGAIALLVVAVIIFGGGQLFATKRYLVTYFPGSVKGLRVGSDVLFRGVRVGYVTDIEVVTDPDIDRFSIPVTFQILPGTFTVESDDGKFLPVSVAESRQRVDALIKRGLRTKLETESFVTGQLLIQLDFYPDNEPVFRGENTQHQEIPSMPSDIQQYMQQLQKLAAEINKQVDAEKLVADIQGIMSGLNKLANSPELQGAVAGLDKLVNAGETQALPGNLQNAAKSLTRTMDDTRQVVAKLDKDVGPLIVDARQVLDSLNVALANATGVLQETQLQLGQEGAINFQLVNTLNEVQRAARSLRTLTDYLEQHPEALIRGKSAQKGNP
jgi:paraquat-inducible protein B